MKITNETPDPDQQDEMILRCSQVDGKLLELIQALKTAPEKLTVYQETEIIVLPLKDVYYFEAVDNKVFACCEKQVYEVRKKLYELEETLGGTDFLRISKSIIVDLSKIRSLAPYFSGRLEAKLKNGEKIIISRQYVPDLKKKLDI